MQRIHSIPLVLILFITVCTVIGCKKDNTTVTPVVTTYSVSFKADGRPVAYNSQTGLTYAYTTSSISHVIEFSDTGATSRIFIRIENGDQPFSISQYATCYPVNGRNQGTSAEYHDSTGMTYLTQCGDSTYGVAATLTEVGTNFVRGTFSGSLRKQDNTGTHLYVTDGAFYVGN